MRLEKKPGLAKPGRTPSSSGLERLVRHALDDERKRVRCLHSGRVDLFLSRRIVPGFCFFRAIELEQDKALRRGSIEACYFVCTDDKTAAKSGDSCRRFFDHRGF